MQYLKDILFKDLTPEQEKQIQKDTNYLIQNSLNNQKNNNMNLDYSNHTQTQSFTANIYIQHPVTEHEYTFMVSGTESYNPFNHYENDLEFEVCEFDGDHLDVDSLMERINMTEEQLNDFVFCSIEDGTIELHYD